MLQGEPADFYNALCSEESIWNTGTPNLVRSLLTLQVVSNPPKPLASLRLAMIAVVTSATLTWVKSQEYNVTLNNSLPA